MKQTNSTIKYLMAHYRAIFKHAFFKGLVSAAIVTGGIALGSAQAADTPTEFNPSNGTFSGTINLTGNNAFTMDGDSYTLTGTQGASISAPEDDPKNFGIVFGGAESATKFNFNSAVFNVKTDDHAGFGARVSFGKGTYNMTGDNYVSQMLTIDAGNLSNTEGTTITLTGGGNLHVTGYLTISMGAGSNKADLSGVNIFVKSGQVGATQTTSNGGLIIDPSITVGNLTFEGDSNINLYYDQWNWEENPSKPDPFSRTVEVDKVIYIADGKTVTFASGSHTISSGVDKDSSAKLDPNHRYTLTFSKASATAANVAVAQGATLNVNRDLTTTDGIKFTNAGSFVLKSGSTFTVSGSSSFVNDGVYENASGATHLISGTGAFTNNGTLNNSGDLIVSGGSLTIASGSTFNNAGLLTISGGTASFDVSVVDQVSDLGNFANSGTLTLTAQNSGSFFINGNDDLSKLLNESPAGTYNGILTLSKVTLESSSDLTLNTDIMDAFDSSSNGQIHADEITYTVDEDNGENLNGVKVFGDDLIFSDGDTDSTPTIVSGSGASTFAAYNVDTDDDSAITLGDQVTLEMINQGTSAQSGSIDVDLTLSGATAAKANLKVQDLAVSAKDITLAQSGEMTVTGSKFATSLSLSGDLTVTDADSSVAVNNAALSANSVSAGAGYITVENSGSLTTKTIDAGTGSIAVTNGTLTINADGDSENSNITSGDKITVTTGTLNLTNAKDTIGLTWDSATSKWSANDDYSAAKIKSSGSTIKVDLSSAVSGTALSISGANSLLGALVSGTGLVDIGSSVNVTLPVDETTGTVDASELPNDNGNITMNFETVQSKQTVLTNVTGTVTGGWSGVKSSGSGQAVTVASTGVLSLYGNASGDNIVSDASGKLVNLNLSSQSVVNIVTSGNVGAISGSGSLILSDQSDLNVLNTSDTTKKADVTVTKLGGTGSIKAADISTTDTALEQGAAVAAANYTVQKTGSFAVNGATVAVTDTLDLTDVDTTKGPAQTSGSLITAKEVKVSEAAFNDGSVVSGETLSGSTSSDVTASASSLNFKVAKLHNLSLVDDAEAFFETLEIKNNGVLAVGSDSGENTTASSAKAQIQYLTLNGGLLQVDPSFNQPTAMVTIDSFTSKITDTNYTPASEDVGSADGSIFVGQNSALGLGLKTLSELQSVITKYQVGSALDQNKYGAVLYVDGALQLNTGYGVTLTSQSLTAFTNSIKNSTLGFNLQNVVENAIYFGKNTALIINGDNLNKNGQAFIFIEGNDSDSAPSKLIAAGGEIVINGDVKAGKTTIFKSNDKDGLQVVNTANQASGSIVVTTENNLLQGTITNNTTGNLTDGTVDLRVNEAEAEAIINAASAPVLETILAYGRGYNGEPDADGNVAAENYLYDLDRKGNKIDYNNYFLQQELIRGNGSSTEKVARLGIYGGTAQAALSAGATTYESVSARMGMGAQNSSLTFADNGQGAGLWLNPIYKSHDSDGFGAQGLSYGTDMSMYGLALGGDFTMANGMRIGAAFNLGSGDADGHGAAAGVSNDFDYYGFTVYGGFSQGPLSVIGDISYTVVDNTVDANTAFEQVHTSLDSTNLSVGVTGQYALNFNGTSITPHAGLRYTKIDLDDYVVKGSAEIAGYNGDSMSVFSIPVGVTVAKEFTAGTWTIKPSFDLTLTANMGDDSIGGSVEWAGVDNLKTNLDSEVLDSFTYGATLGVAAKSGNFSLGLGVNYTGASNADEYGVQANARFVF